MRCPFLREAQVKFCKSSAYKKMILRTAANANGEKCSLPDYVTCPEAKVLHEEQPSQSHCPFLHESLVQYCSAASVTKYIPYSESLLSRCGNESHLHCELYLAMAEAEVRETSAVTMSRKGPQEDAMDEWVEGIRVPLELGYSGNHMWMETNKDGVCHVGVDAFLTRMIAGVDKLSFLTAKGVQRPTAVLTVNGADLHMVFPYYMHITGTNNYLRANLEKLVADPYGPGWLFEGVEPQAAISGAEFGARAGLVRGKAAVEWMKKEVDRASEFVHERIAQSQPEDKRMVMDGGIFTGELIHHLNREEVLNLFNQFFSPYASWRRWW